jgi:hypothetical protein
MSGRALIRRRKALRPCILLALAASAPSFGNDNLSIVENALGNVNVTAGPDFFATDNSAILTPTTIQTALASSNVSAHTGAGGVNSEPGDIFLMSSVTSLGAGFGFAIDAARNITGTATVDTSGSTAAGGFLTLLASAGAITVSDLRARGASGTTSAFNGGTISLTAATGITAGALRADSTSGNGASSAGANIILTTTAGNIAASSLFAETDAATANSANAGTISATASAGSISFSGQLSTGAYSSSGSRLAGAISLSASGPLTLADQVAANSFIGIGSGNSSSGGAITMRASQITALGLITSSSEVDSANFTVSGNAGNAGNIGITATVSSISMSGALSADSHSKSGAAGNGGAIAVRANSFATFAGVASESKVRTSGAAGNAGNISLNANNNLLVTGDITAYSLSPSGSTGLGGNVILSGENVTANNIYTYSDATGGASSRAGNVTFISNGAVAAQSILAYSRSSNSTPGGGGNVTFGCSTVSAATIDTSSSSVGGVAGIGGFINVAAGKTIDISGIAKSSSTSLVNSSNAAGNITLSASTQVHLNSADARSTSSTGGTISITSNEINLGPGFVSANAIQSNGALLLQPTTASQDINVGDSADAGTSSLDLLATELGCLAPGFSSITIGRTNSSGNMTVSPVTFQSPTILRIPSGSITIASGTLAGTGNASFAITAPSITFAGTSPAITTQSQPITLTGAVSVASNSTVNSPGVPITINGSLAVAPAAHLDLGANTLVINYTGASPASAIRALLATGFHSGSWDGPGLSSLAAHNDATFRTALGYIDTGSQIRVKYTYYGDSNLDGKVDVADFEMFLDGFASGSAGSWAQGDYTYDGNVDLGNDFNLFLSTYLRQGNSLGDLQGAIEAEPLAPSQRAALLSLVPEPSSVFTLAALPSLALRRRKRGV